MKIIKRGNLAILSLSIMIMIAGYINYRYDPEREKNLGKTVLVNSNENSIYTEAATKQETIYKNKSSETIHKIKSDREDMYSELEASYREAMSVLTGSENVKIYEDKLDNIIKEKHKINLIETLVKTKGIENLAINKMGEKIIAVVSGNNLTESQVALIKKIIQDELNVKTEDITITQE